MVVQRHRRQRNARVTGIIAATILQLLLLVVLSFPILCSAGGNKQDSVATPRIAGGKTAKRGEYPFFGEFYKIKTLEKTSYYEFAMERKPNDMQCKSRQIITS